MAWIWCRSCCNDARTCASDAARQAYRQAVLDVTLDDLRRVAAAYLVPARASTAVITSQANLQRAGELGLTAVRL